MSVMATEKIRSRDATVGVLIDESECRQEGDV